MPYARISLLKGKPPAYLRAISDGLQRALVATFDVPEADCFQIFDQMEPEEFVFDRSYLCGPRSDAYVLIALTAGKPRSQQTKKDFYRRLVELLEKAPGLRREDVMVVIHMTEPEDWSFGNGLATLVQDA
ncbi:MAG: tautomerase family protein [Betaproteobacteria bacterium]|jgi:phenylpyruvate tautomerase PptA (4-oxalocrotonate tautomerase family)|nr:tautomerase family protein [Betaproteobacteria bacterium]